MRAFLFAFITIFSFQVLSLKNSLSARQVADQLKIIQSCKNNSCFSKHFSQDLSQLEKSRLLAWIQNFKIKNPEKWNSCQMKMRELEPTEVCFSQPEDDERFIRIILKKESHQWKIKHLSLPSY